MKHFTKLFVLFAAVIGTLSLAGAGWAYWTTSGSGSASGSVGTLNAPTLSAPSASGIPVALSWTTVTAPGSGSVSYYVLRNGLAASAACPGSSTATSVTSCSDTVSGSGTYHYTVTAVWRTWTATSAEAPVTVTVSSDSVAPTATIGFPANGTTSSAAAYGAGCSPTGICGTASDASGVQAVRISIRQASSGNYWSAGFSSPVETFNPVTLGTPNAPSTSWNYTFGLPADGSYTIHVQATDTLGNAQAAGIYAATSTFTIDATAPATTDNVSGSWTKTAQTVTLSPTDTGGSGVAHTYYTTNGSTPTTSSTQGTSFTLSTQGSYTIKYFSVDVAGNTETVKTAANQVNIDTTVPVTTDNATSAWTNSQTVTLTPSDTGGSGVSKTYHTTDGSTPTTGSAQTTTFTLSTQGTYTIKYFSVDVAGNTEAVKTATNQVNIDTTVPVTTDNVSGSWTKTAQTVTLSPTDTGGSGVAHTYYTTNGSTPTTSSTQGTSFTLSTQGSYTIKYFSVDVAGNTETVKTAANQVNIDTTVPVTTDNATSAWTNSQTVTLTPSDTGGSGVSKTYHTTDGSTPTTGSAQTTTFTLSTQGTYTIKYFSVDVAGNTEAVKTATNQVNIDTTPPSGGAVTVNAVAATGGGSTSTTNSTSFTIGTRTNYTETASGTASGLASSILTVQSATSGVTCGVPGSGGPYTTATTITLTTNPAITAGFCYLYTLTGTDNAGNSASIKTTVKVTSAPTITSPTSGTGNTFTLKHGTSGTLIITGTGFQSGVTVSVSNGFTGIGTATVTGSTQISVPISATSNPQGTYHLTITNPDGGTAVSNSSMVNN